MFANHIPSLQADPLAWMDVALNGTIVHVWGEGILFPKIYDVLPRIGFTEAATENRCSIISIIAKQKTNNALY
jgi:hypothetical protein